MEVLSSGLDLTRRGKGTVGCPGYEYVQYIEGVSPHLHRCKTCGCRSQNRGRCVVVYVVIQNRRNERAEASSVSRKFGMMSTPKISSLPCVANTRTRAPNHQVFPLSSSYASSPTSPAPATVPCCAAAPSARAGTASSSKTRLCRACCCPAAATRAHGRGVRLHPGQWRRTGTRIRTSCKGWMSGRRGWRCGRV
ncbi:hypothetical protein BDZ88DRAFT_158084 [Geranomyces variabilis]|nr:hypothetical protein BDZ88DRAFT_158084 [Geranomyces variabilis]